jgi:hypothetical protein
MTNELKMCYEVDTGKRHDDRNGWFPIDPQPCCEFCKYSHKEEKEDEYLTCQSQDIGAFYVSKETVCRCWEAKK